MAKGKQRKLHFVDIIESVGKIDVTIGNVETIEVV
jgi:hypothetical protein